MRRWLSLGAGFLFALLVAACTVGGDSSQPKVIRGVLLQVESRSLTEIDAIRLRDGDGHEWTFRVAPDAKSEDDDRPPDPSHLRLHMAQGEQVIVRYRETDSGLVAVAITH